jgi:cell division septal protein FtsQ
MALFATASLIGVVLIVVGVQWALARPTVRIQDVRIQGAGSTPTQLLQASVRAALTGMYAGMVPKDNTFFVNTANVRDRLLSLFPRLKDAQVRRDGLSALAVLVTERTPRALWCGDIVPSIAYEAGRTHTDDEPEELWGSCYLMDDESYIFAAAPVYTGNVLPRYYGPLDHAEPIGQHFISPQEFDYWSSLYAALSDAHLNVRAFLVVDEQEIEFYLADGVRVLARRDTTPEKIVRQLTAAHGAPSVGDFSTIEYIDLRFPDKVYYKYRSG